MTGASGGPGGGNGSKGPGRDPRTSDFRQYETLNREQTDRSVGGRQSEAGRAMRDAAHPQDVAARSAVARVGSNDWHQRQRAARQQLENRVPAPQPGGPSMTSTTGHVPRHRSPVQRGVATPAAKDAEGNGKSADPAGTAQPNAQKPTLHLKAFSLKESGAETSMELARTTIPVHSGSKAVDALYRRHQQPTKVYDVTYVPPPGEIAKASSIGSSVEEARASVTSRKSIQPQSTQKEPKRDPGKEIE